MRCIYCMPRDGTVKCSHAEVLRFEQICRFVEVVRSAFGLVKLHVTGGEPLVRKDIDKLISMLAGLRPDDFALTTNGLELPEMAGRLRQAGLLRVNISLDSLRADTYRRLTRGGDLARVLTGIDAALEAGLYPVKLNVAVINGINRGEVADIARFGMRLGCPVRFLELMPIGPARARFRRWFVPSEAILAELSKAFELTPAPVPAGSSTVYYHAAAPDGARGLVGVISSCSRPFCDSCRRLRLTARGELVGCLAQGDGRSIRRMLVDGCDANEADLVNAIRQVLSIKRTGRRFTTARLMSQTGG